jgi:cation transport regulator ChaB
VAPASPTDRYLDLLARCQPARRRAVTDDRDDRGITSDSHTVDWTAVRWRTSADRDVHAVVGASP